MRDSAAYIYAAGKWVIAAIAAAWVSIPAAAHTLMFLMMLDFATGLVAAFIEKKLCSRIASVGFAKKMLTLVVIVLAHLVTGVLPDAFAPLGAAVVIVYVIIEALSILENCARVGVPIPAVLLDALLRAKSMTGTKVKGEPEPENTAAKNTTAGS